MPQESILISGATGFLGKNISLYFAKKGYKLVLLSKNEIALQELRDNLIESLKGIDVVSFVCDVENMLQLNETLKSINRINPDHFINCTGLQGVARLSPSQFDFDELEKIIKVNLYFPMKATYNFLNHWDLSKFHSIIHFSGGGSTSPRPLFVPYSLSKTALVRFVENIALLNQNTNLRINAISPGLMPSQMQVKILADSQLRSSGEFESAIQSFSEGEDNVKRVLELCDYLIAEKSCEINGKIISPKWDKWRDMLGKINLSVESDFYTLRRKI